ncbi:response regulator transcription factor [Spirosoma taeanense]|uniref:Response regulator transcription factor n=1 Tax=Spirosoma taeanense TaxID=2735870 RepID=A0A6M5YAN6_9BACT|nr:response regulator transcription factor [Spirosoma taeanense]QJW91257.1 response regulator transcription factor [Spirosoma taeanense]
MDKVKSVLIAEDFPLMTASIKRILYDINPEYDVQCVSRLAEAEKMLLRQSFDLLIADVQLFDEKQAGLRLVTLARQQHPAIRSVIYTQFDDAEVVQAGVLAGANGYVVKYETEAQLRLVLQAVVDGEEYLSPAVARTLIQLQQRRVDADGQSNELKALTLDELAIIKLVAEDMPKKEIAAQMNLSPSAIYAQVKRIAEKIGVVGDVGIALFARKNGLI